MAEDVVISIRGMQRAEGADEDDAIEFVTDGSYSFDGNEASFTYKESELTGLEGTVTTFRVKPEAVLLTRKGKVNSHMMFAVGKRHGFFYDTPFGAISMGVSTSTINSNLNEGGGTLEIFYALDMENAPFGKNAFLINITKPGEVKH